MRSSLLDVPTGSVDLIAASARSAVDSRHGLSPLRRLLGYPASLFNRAHDLYWETRLGIRTTRDAPSNHPDAHRYGYVAYHTYLSILKHLALTPADTLVDLGCGKGRVVCAAAAAVALREAIGVEIDPALCAEAVANGARLRLRRAPLRFVCESAVDLDYDDVTAVILFHPFGIDTWNRVLDRLHESLRRRERTLRLVYINPEYGDVPAARPWLERYERWHPRPWSRLKFSVDFFRSLRL